LSQWAVGMNKLLLATYMARHGFSGKLLIDGDLQDNCMLIRFLFDKPEIVHPLIVRIRVRSLLAVKRQSGRHAKRVVKEFVYACNIPDLNNPVMKSRLIYPDYLLGENKVWVIGVESQVSCDFCLTRPIDVLNGK